MNTDLKLITLTDSAWDSWQVEGTPFGIEKIAPRDYVVFRFWGGARVYMSVTKDKGFTSRDMALLYLEGKVKEYKENIITAITA